MTFTVKRKWSDKEGCYLYGIMKDGKLHEGMILYGQKNANLVAEYLNMTDEEREQVEDEAYDLFVESMQSYITENTMLIRSHIREVYRWMIETGHMAVRPIVRKAPIEAIAELFTQLDEE